MSKPITIRNADGEMVDICSLKDDELNKLILHKERYRGQETGWKTVALLVKQFKKRRTKYILSIDDMEALNEGKTVNKHGVRIMMEWADELEEIKGSL